MTHNRAVACIALSLSIVSLLSCKRSNNKEGGGASTSNINDNKPSKEIAVKLITASQEYLSSTPSSERNPVLSHVAETYATAKPEDVSRDLEDPRFNEISAEAKTAPTTNAASTEKKTEADGKVANASSNPTPIIAQVGGGSLILMGLIGVGYTGWSAYQESRAQGASASTPGLKLTEDGGSIRHSFEDIANRIGRDIYRKPFPTKRNSGGLLVRDAAPFASGQGRWIHGFANSLRVANLMPYLFEIYQKHSTKDFSKDESFKWLVGDGKFDSPEFAERMKIFQTAAMMRASGRTKDTDSGWNSSPQAKIETEAKLTSMGVDPTTSKMLADVVFKADIPTTMPKRGNYAGPIVPAGDRDFLTTLLAEATTLESLRDFTTKTFKKDAFAASTRLTVEGVESFKRLVFAHTSLIKKQQGFWLGTLDWDGDDLTPIVKSSDGLVPTSTQGVYQAGQTTRTHSLLEENPKLFADMEEGVRQSLFLAGFKPPPTVAMAQPASAQAPSRVGGVLDDPTKKIDSDVDQRSGRKYSDQGSTLKNMGGALWGFGGIAAGIAFIASFALSESPNSDALGAGDIAYMKRLGEIEKTLSQK